VEDARHLVARVGAHRRCRGAAVGPLRQPLGGLVLGPQLKTSRQGKVVLVVAAVGPLRQPLGGLVLGPKLGEEQTRQVSQTYMLNTWSEEQNPVLIFSLFCEYTNHEYVRIHAICRVNLAEYAIRIPLAVPQELVNTYSTRRVTNQKQECGRTGSRTHTT